MEHLHVATQTTFWPEPIDITFAVFVGWLFTRVVPVVRAAFDRPHRVRPPSLRAGLVGFGITAPAIVVASFFCDRVQIVPDNVSALLVPAAGFVGGLLLPVMRRLLGRSERLDDSPAVFGEFLGAIVAIGMLIAFV